MPHSFERTPLASAIGSKRKLPSLLSQPQKRYCPTPPHYAKQQNMAGIQSKADVGFYF